MTGIDASNALAGIPDGLRKPLLDEFNKLARHFRESRWEPAELNGGKLCEIVFTILSGHVSGKFPSGPSKPSNMVDACLALQKATLFPRSVRIQMPRMIVALYEIRNNRNVGHVGSDVDPSHMDASVVFSMCQWIMAELVRIFHDITTEEAVAVVESLVERSVPLLWAVGGRTRVLNAKLSARDKTLVLLYSSAVPLDVQSVLKSIEYKNAAQFRAKVLQPAHAANLIDFDRDADRLTLSPVGIQFVETRIPLVAEPV